MKLIVLLLTVTLFNLTANVYSQNTLFSFYVEGKPVKEILKMVEDQSNFRFLYNDEFLGLDRPVTLDVKNSGVEDLLNKLLYNQGLTYKFFENNLIVITPVSINLKQAVKVSGTVTDATTGEPVIGANVLIEGTTVGVVTDVNGRFSLDIPKPDVVILIKFLGYNAQRIPMNGETVLDVKLEPDVTKLDEVVVVGYGSMKKSDLTGSVASIRSEQIAQVQSSTLEQSLVGRAAGVQITQSEGAPGAGVKIRIRGGTSINASSDPLYVIDGFPIQASTNPTSTGLGITGTSVLSTMNPSDILSVEVLKDASATAIYGSRGANGVVIITTKSGGAGKQNITFDAYTGISKITKTLDVLNGPEFIDFYYYMTNISYLGDNRIYALRDQNNNPILDHYNYRGDPIWKPAPISTFQQHNWQDEIFRTGAVQNYNLSMSGGTKNLNYLASVGYFNQKGIIVGSNYERYTGSFKLDNNFSDKFRIGLNINTGYTINDGVLSATQTGHTGSGAITNALAFVPVLGYDLYGKLVTDPNSEFGTEISNPYKVATETKLTSYNFYIRPNLYLDYDLLPGLKLRISAGSNLSTNRTESWYPGSFGYGLSAGGGAAFQTNNNTLEWLNENTLSYIKQIDKHKINVVAGFTQQGSTSKGYSLKATGFQIQSINIDNMGSAIINQSGSGSYKSEWGLKSWLGRANYSYMDKYLLTLTGRADGSSRFPKGSKWAFFPSGAIAWRISEEPFLRDIKVLNDLKLHGSYGISGNQAIDVYSSLANYRFANYAFDENMTTGLTAQRLENNALTWETTKQVDVGVDIGLFDNRVYLTAGYYRKVTDDLLLQVNVPLTTGYSNAWMNAGAIENHGMEFNLNTVNVNAGGFTWNSSFNISFNRNKVQKLYSELNYFYVSGPGEPGTSFIVKEGEPIGSMFGFIFDGVYQLNEFTYDASKNYEELVNIKPSEGGYDLKPGGLTRVGTRVLPGAIKFKDINGRDANNNLTGKPDGKINDDDRTIIGQATPDFYGGFSNDFSYKNFDLSIFLNYSYGNNIYNKNLFPSLAMDNPFKNSLKKALGMWTVNNPTNKLWGATGLTYGGGSGSHSYYIEDGSFIRLSNVTLGYSLPKQMISKLKLSNARVYVSGDNLYVWTKYSGYDPEVSVGFDNLAPGVDWGAYPRSRSFRLGIKLDF